MNIKAKITAVISACLIMSMMLGGCQLSKIFGNGGTTTAGAGSGTASDATTEPPVTAAVPDAIDYSELDFSKYVKLDYKNITLEVSALPIDPTGDELERELGDRMVTMGLYELDTAADATRLGDYIEMEYTGYMEGETFEGGTSDKATIYLDIENRGYIAGFADGLIGVKPGDTVELNLVFPENYYDDISGKPVTFKVKVHGVCRLAKNDESASKLSNGKYKSMDAYREYLREYLRTISDYNALSEVSSELWNQVLERSEVLEYPEKQYQYYYALLTNDYIAAANQAGKDYDAYLAENGITPEKIDEAIKGYIKTELLVNGIATAENMTVTEEEYDEYVNRYYAYYASQYMIYGMTKEQIVSYLREQAFNEKVLYTVFRYCALTQKKAEQ